MSEGYLIVYRDGLTHGPIRDKPESDLWLEVGLQCQMPSNRPAYRIRIREKPIDWFRKPTFAVHPPTSSARLDPAKAYADAGIRR
jgi:hypothetical protein